MIALAVCLDLQLCGTVTGLQPSLPQYSWEPLPDLRKTQPLQPAHSHSCNRDMILNNQVGYGFALLVVAIVVKQIGYGLFHLFT